nr:hypothetical protein [uncultured Blautia sp.]
MAVAFISVCFFHERHQSANFTNNSSRNILPARISGNTVLFFSMFFAWGMVHNA